MAEIKNDDPYDPKRKPFLIVGIGASAGGLEAFQEFFRDAPSDCAIAFVLVQHLAPEHESLLTEILQRVTVLPVIEVKDQMLVMSNHVYVIPPNRDMTIHDGLLQLSPPEQPRGQRMPIDEFFISLANEQKNQAIGVILSGTGTDGTIGLQAIHDLGGRTFVQDPKSAKYDGMPNSAIASGCVSETMLAEEMILAILNSTDSVISRISTSDTSKKKSFASFLHILLILRNASGHDFTQYKKSTIRRRIERCMAIHSIYDTEEYAIYLKNNPLEIQTLLNELLINVTSFFRDPEAFSIISKEVLPLLFEDKNEGDYFRVWIAGCASGEEAYSIAILLREYMDRVHKEFKIQIYATDLDDESIAEARAGVYQMSIAEVVSKERLKRFFIEEDFHYRVKKEIRDMVVFAVQNVIKDPPLIKLDLLCCRNLMIYLEPELQNKLIPIFHYALRPKGVLFLSPAESVGNHTERFHVLNRKYKLYQAIALAPLLKNNLKIEKKWVATSNTTTLDSIQKTNVVRAIQPEKSPHLLSQNNDIHESKDDEQASHEDLKSTNEELQSTNEELQSTNEELETSKEELQSVNEELVTVNNELQKKIEQLAGIQNDMKNLLDNMNIGTIFLDKELIIRRFTREATKAYRLIATDVGRSIEDIKCTLKGPIDLLLKAKDVLKSQQAFEAELSTQDGNWYLAHIQLYKTLDNIVAGVVLTFTDITARVVAENAVKTAKKLAEGIVDTVLEPLVVLDATLKVVSASRSFYQYFQVEPEQTVGRLIYDLGNQQWNIPALRNLLETILPHKKSFEGYVVEHHFQNIGLQKMILNGRRIIDSDGNTQLILFAMQPVPLFR